MKQETSWVEWYRTTTPHNRRALWTRTMLGVLFFFATMHFLAWGVKRIDSLMIMHKENEIMRERLCAQPINELLFEDEDGSSYIYREWAESCRRAPEEVKIQSPPPEKEEEKGAKEKAPSTSKKEKTSCATIRRKDGS